ncbi:MAG: translation initiation factor IF-2 [Candidatus Dojkabacteria bacterium]|jgi:translation initiation factor IF-2|nr:translation initiation factor IF-2 [Candidatus Dojkabacteria bacterium]
MVKKDTKQNVCVQSRVPIVAILGHVDHGKTTILDYIRKSHVQSCEAGGITQKISVFTVSPNGDYTKQITFVDTPGHEAFDLMRTRGGIVADIVLLVVAANDGVKPQTVESIEILKNSSAKPIVVINKVDLPDTDLAKIKRDLVNNGLLIEGMGGSIPVIEVSGKTGKGINELLDLINLVADVEGLQQRGDLPKGVAAKAYVLESVKDKTRGNVSTLVLVSGDLCKGSWLGYKKDGEFLIEKVKGIISEDGENICDLSCGCGGKIIGISNLIPLGSEVYILQENSKKLLSSLYKEEVKEIEEISLVEDDNFSAIFDEEQSDGDTELNVIVKSSSQGSLEALKNSLSKVKKDGYSVNIVSEGVGDISNKDIDMAKLSKAILLGFEVGLEKGAEDLAKKSGVLVRTYSIIYKLIEEIEDALDMLSTPAHQEEEIGNAIIKMMFTLSDGSKVLGSRVKDGILKRDCKIYVVRNDEVLVEGKIRSLRKGKETVTEVKQGEDCGVILDIDVEANEGDELYCYKVSR